MKFSIVIPTYNRSALIEKTIESLLSQTFEDFEIIVVDDGGTDNTGEIVKSIKDPRVQYHWKENEERAAARNFGARLSKGEYINFFDSDDLAYSNHLSEATKAVEELNTPEIFHLGYDIKGVEENLIKEVNNLPPQLNENLHKGNIISCNGVFIRKDIVDKYPFNTDRDLSATEDWELWMRLAARFTLHHINVITSTVINHDERSIIKINREKLIKRKELFIKYLKQDDKFVEKYGQHIRRMTADSYTFIALHLGIANHSFFEVLKFLIKSLKEDPGVILEKRFWASIKNGLI